jgi:hypothetical protein
MTAIETESWSGRCAETGVWAMNGTQFWEFKEGAEQNGSEREEESIGLHLSRLAVNNRIRNAGRYSWKGPGTLWVAKDDRLPKR